MRIDQVTKFRCDGCGREEANPISWISIIPRVGGNMTMTVGSAAPSEDYCAECTKRIRATAKAT